MRRRTLPLLLPFLLVATPSRAGTDLAAASDPFDDIAALRQWKHLAQEEGFPSMVKDVGLHADTGCLHLEPGTSLWTGDFRAPFLFKEIEGDFVLTTRLRVRGKRFATPATRYCLAGALARGPRDITAATWTPGHENWVSLMTGSGSKVHRAVLEARSTVDSQTDRSSLPLTEWGWVQLRMVRVGPTFLLLARPEGEAWRVVDRLSRPDLPAVLQVGLTACDDWMSAMALHDDPATFNTHPFHGNPDSEAMFDYATFAAPAVPKDVDVSDPALGDDRILALFGD